MLDRSMLDTLCQLARGVAEQFGESCEVVVYELDPWRQEGRVVAAENSRSPDTEQEERLETVVRDVLKSSNMSLFSDRLAYLVRTENGRILRRSTVYVRDTKGAVCGVFEMSWDITDFLAAGESLCALTGGEKRLIAEDGQASRSTPLHVSELLGELITQSVQLIGKSPSEMTKEEKIRAIQFLNQSGAFLITKSGDRIAKEFNISKYTLYSYIDAGKEK